MDLTRPGTVGILICCFTAARLRELQAAVTSALGQTYRPDVVLVLVDGTEELATEIAAGLGIGDADSGPLLRMHCLGSNQGVSQARNQGIAEIGTDFVAMLDDDAVAEPEWLGELMAPMGDPHVLGSSGWALPLWDGPRPGWLPEEFLWTVGCSYRGMPTETTRVRNFHGGAALLRAETFLDVGGFDPAAGYRGRWAGGAEEADYCLRATQRTGGWFVATPRALMRHHVPASRLRWRYFIRRCYGEGVMKGAMSRRLRSGSHERGALGPERSFGLRMPLAMLRAVATRGERGQAVGIAVGVVAVLAGLLRASLSRGLTD